jgi:hypothetical protein
MKFTRKRGSTSNIFDLFISDSLGAGKTGLTSSSAGLIVAVKRELVSAYTVYAQASSNIETITTIGTFAAPTSSKCRFKEIDATNAAGMYQVMIADAIFDNGDASRFVTGIVWGASGMNPCPFEIQLDAFDLNNSEAEPGQGAPPATAHWVTKLGYMYKAWRNRSTQTSSDYKLYNDDATTVDQKASFSYNGTTADRGEVATGP